jgi:adenosylcobinamide-GDP ribazoletransferase
VGTFGVLALIVAVGLTVSTVAALDTSHAARTLATAHVLARWAILPLSQALHPARPGGAGALLRVTTPALLAGTALAVAAALVVAGPADGAAAVAAAALAALLAAGILQRGLGGVTGDGYGATAKLAEVAVCATLAALWT